MILSNRLHVDIEFYTELENQLFKSYLHRRCYHKGTQFLQHGDWWEAVSLLRRAIELKPGDSWSHNNLAIALLKLGHFEESSASFQRAIQLNSDFSQSHENLGMALMKLYRWEEAVAVYRRALTLDPTNLDLQIDLGNALIRLERWEEAATTFRGAIELDPTDPRAYSLLATVFTKTEPSEEVLERYQKLVTLSPDKPFARLGLGVELLKIRKWEEAISCLRSVDSQASDYASCQFLLVEPLLRLGRFEEAAAAHLRVVELGGSLPSLPGEPAERRFELRRNGFWACENLSPQVFRIERWLQQLVSVAASASPSSALASNRTGRLLFVLDNDYGELTTLMYLLLGQALVRQATLLLPDRLFANNSDALPGQTHHYASMEDVLQVVDTEKPDVVFLCSGYLFPIHQILSLDELKRLSGALLNRGCRIVTTDPFLGMLSQQDPKTLISIDIPKESNFHDMEKMRRVKEVDDEILRKKFSSCEQVLRKVPHLYPAFCEVPSHERAEIEARNLSFFNAELLCPHIGPGAETAGDSLGRPHWLFILSQTDYDTQMMFEGSEFEDIVARILLDTLVAGRHPILIAPDELIHRVIPRMPTVDGVDILSFCPFNRLMSLQLSAEYVFYWNVVSHSILIRLFNRLPVILFDKGHLVRNVTAMYDRVVQWYYQGWAPKFLDHRVPLTLETVSAWVTDYQLEANSICEGFRRAPTPEQMINSLVLHDQLAST